MSFDTAEALKKSTSRSKSDVANKLVSMLLHEISRKACAAGNLFVSDSAYTSAVVDSFGNRCIYCDEILVSGSAAVEHLDGMNRIRVGLHVPGNVAMACRVCNNQKRRDDQKQHLTLADSGWESFLSHNGDHCSEECKTCTYWRLRIKDRDSRNQHLETSKERIRQFRIPFASYVQWSEAMRKAIQTKVESLYRDCQNFATNEIEKLTGGLDYQSIFSED